MRCVPARGAAPEREREFQDEAGKHCSLQGWGLPGQGGSAGRRGRQVASPQLTLLLGESRHHAHQGLVTPAAQVEAAGGTPAGMREAGLFPAQIQPYCQSLQCRPP